MEIYSPTYSEGEAVGYLTEQMENTGFQAEIDPAGNAIGRIGSGEQHVLLLGHIDTVPGKLPVRKQGDLLFGRGAVDAKGPLAAFVAAASQCTNQNIRITVVGAVHEEGNSAGASHLREHFPKPDALIIGEPSGWDQVTLGYKGSVTYMLTATSDVAQPASKKTGVCETTVTAWDKIVTWTNEFNQGRSMTFEKLTPTLRTMHSDSDGIVEHAQLQVTFRLPEGLSVPEMDSQIRDLIGNDIAIESLAAAVPAYRAPKNTGLVRSALASIRTEGGKPRFLLKTGTSDMNIVAPTWGCPTIAYGPGDSSLDHTPDEHVSLSEFRRSIVVIRDIIERLGTSGQLLKK